MTTVDQADMRALGSARLLCVTELPRPRLWGVALAVRSNNAAEGSPTASAPPRLSS